MKRVAACALLSLIGAMPLQAEEMAHSSETQGAHAAMDEAIHELMLFNRFEAWDARPGTGFSWEARGWLGTDDNRIWLRTEGDRSSGRTDSADVELLYGHSVSTWWDIVGGVRHDFAPGMSQTFGAVGVRGLAPQRVELALTAYVGSDGQSAARAEAEYELLLTNRLVLQPRFEANLYGKRDVARNIGSGLSTLQAGVRLRYEISRQFAPYIGWSRERAIGQTSQLRRIADIDVTDTHLVAGVRVWF